jgi:hypothetical protein
VVAGEVAGLVTGFAAHGGHAVAILAAFYVLQVDVAVVALERSVASGMASLAARRRENFVDFEKGFCGSSGVGRGMRWRSVRIRYGENDQDDSYDCEGNYPDQRKVCAGVL